MTPEPVARAVVVVLVLVVGVDGTDDHNVLAWSKLTTIIDGIAGIFAVVVL